jgi:ABC-type antimicrobial peptide transport system permease subunit
VVGGLALAAAATRTLERLLYGVTPLNPVTFAAVAVLVTVGALVVSYLAARRVLRIDLIELLRAE